MHTKKNYKRNWKRTETKKLLVEYDIFGWKQNFYVKTK